MLKKLRRKLHLSRGSRDGHGALQLLDQDADDVCLAAIKIQRFWRAYRERRDSRKSSTLAWARWRLLIDLVDERWLSNQRRPGTVPAGSSARLLLAPPAPTRSCRSLSPLPRSSSDQPSPRRKASRDDLVAVLERGMRNLFGSAPPAERPFGTPPAGPSSSAAARRAIQGEDLEILEQLGDGDTGKVFLVRLRGTSQLYALKTVSKKKAQDESKVTRILIEREILELADHPFVIRLEAAFQNEEYLFLVLEYCSGGDLFTRLQSLPFKFLPEKDAQFYAAEILLALEYLHMMGYVYRDLKPENILLSHAGHIKLADFDLAARSSIPQAQLVRRRRRLKKKAAGGIVDIQPRDRFNSRVGTVGYAAPEVLKEAGHTSAVDWWTFGVLLHEMLFGRLPFTGSAQQQLLQIMSGSVSFPEFPQVSSAAKHLIKKLLSPNPKKRLGSKHGAADIRQHPFFGGVNWALIRNQNPPWQPPEKPLPRAPMPGQALALFGPSRRPSGLPPTASYPAASASARIRATDLRRPPDPCGGTRRLNPFLDEHMAGLTLQAPGPPGPGPGPGPGTGVSTSGSSEEGEEEDEGASSESASEATETPPPPAPAAAGAAVRGRPVDPRNPFAGFELVRALSPPSAYPDVPPTHHSRLFTSF
eukprot:tig00020563_g11358.t1